MSNTGNSNENVQGVENDSFDVAGGFEGVDKSQSVSDFVSANCIGSVRREIPGEFLDLSLEELFKKKGAAADKCYKLLNQDRFRK